MVSLTSLRLYPLILVLLLALLQCVTAQEPVPLTFEEETTSEVESIPLPVFTQAELDLMVLEDEKIRKAKVAGGDVSADFKPQSTGTGTARLVSISMPIHYESISNFQLNEPVVANSHTIHFSPPSAGRYLLKGKYYDVDTLSLVHTIDQVEPDSQCKLEGTLFGTFDFIINFTDDNGCNIKVNVIVNSQKEDPYLRTLLFSFLESSGPYDLIASVESHHELLIVTSDSVSLDNGDFTSTFGIEVVYSSLILIPSESKVTIPIKIGNHIQTSVRHSDGCKHKYDSRLDRFLITYSDVPSSKIGFNNPISGIRCSSKITTSTLQLQNHRKSAQNVQVFLDSRPIYSRRLPTILGISDVQVLNVNRVQDKNKSHVTVDLSANPAFDSKGNILVVFNTDHEYDTNFTCRIGLGEGIAEVISLPSEQHKFYYKYKFGVLLKVDEFPYSYFMPRLIFTCTFTRSRTMHSRHDVVVYAYTIDYPEPYTNLVTENRTFVNFGTYLDPPYDDDDDNSPNDDDNGGNGIFTIIGFFASIIVVLCL